MYSMLRSNGPTADVSLDQSMQIEVSSVPYLPFPTSKESIGKDIISCLLSMRFLIVCCFPDLYCCQLKKYCHVNIGY